MIVLKTTQSKLLAILQSISGIVERRHTMPVLANVLLVKKGSNIELTTSDLEIQIKTNADLGGDDGDFSTTVGVRKLIDILKTIPPEQSVGIESQQSRLILKAGKSRFTLQTLPAANFPLVNESPDFGPKFQVPQKALKNLLDQVAFSMAVNDIRYYLNGILFVAEENKLSLVATDSHRLAFSSANLDVQVPRREVILPRKTVIELQRLLSDAQVPDGEAAPMIEMQFAANQARFTFAGLEFVTKLVEGKFPDYTRVIPEGQKNSLTLGRAAFLSCLQRTAIMTTDKFKGVRLSFEANILRVASSNSEQEEAVDELDIDYQGDNVETGFNVTYLIDVLTHSNSEMVRLSFQDGSSTMLISLPDDPAFKYVLMPMKV